MNALATGSLLAAALTTVMRLAVTGRLSMFSAARARLNTRSLRSNNAAMMLSAAALGGLGVSIASNLQRWHAIDASADGVMAIALLVGVLALVAFPSADVVVGVVGFASEVAAEGLEHGVAGAISVIVLAMLLLTLLAIARFVRGA